ncbi:WecB/TagA/CpsF family glycosyltransferase [Rhodococcus aetherivorans]
MNSDNNAIIDDSYVRVGKIPFIATTADKACGDVIRWGLERKSISVRLSNAYCVAVASNDRSYAEVLNDEGVNFPDGRPVVWAMKARSRGSVIAGHVRGPSLFRNVLDRGRSNDLKHFFLGATDETLEDLYRAACNQYPGIAIAGMYSPQFGPVDSSFLDDVSKRVNAADPDIVWVALGTPKQDFCTAALCKMVQRPCVGVGAAFDFVAGTISEAPAFFQKFGIEWIYRFASEPRRLWKRYVFGNFTFIRSALTESGN